MCHSPILCFVFNHCSIEDESVNCFFDQNSFVDFIMPFFSLQWATHAFKKGAG